MKSALRCAENFVLVFLLVILSFPAAYSSGKNEEYPPTTLRGCLRTIGDQAYILIGEDRLGYILSGDRKVLSRHTDEEVLIAGTADERSPDHGPASSPLQTQILMHQSDKKSKHEVSDIPGLVTVHVSSLMPLAEECSQSPSVQ